MCTPCSPLPRRQYGLEHPDCLSSRSCLDDTSQSCHQEPQPDPPSTRSVWTDSIPASVSLLRSNWHREPVRRAEHTGGDTTACSVVRSSTASTHSLWGCRSPVY